MANVKTESHRSSYVLFFLLLFIVLMLEIIHLPAVIAPFRPDFAALLMIFFAISDPKRINVGISWIVGLLLDLLTGAPMGINALALSFQVYIIVSQFRHFAYFSWWQQSLIIGIVNFISHTIVYWLEHLISQTDTAIPFSYQTVSTMVFWPFIYVLSAILWRALNIRDASFKHDKDL